MPALSAVRSIPDTTPPDNRTLGGQVLLWTARFLLQPDGVNAGERWTFTREQARMVYRWYQIDDRGQFVFRRGVIRRMKGHGKDPFVAALSAVELCGPCRFGGWDANGMPVAIPHPAPWIQVAAVSQDQTRNTMTLFPGLFSPDAIDEYRLDLGKTIIYGRGGVGRIEAVTSSPPALEGGRPTLVVLNESHLWVQSNDGLAMADVIRRNLAKSNDGSARSLEITNAHLPGEGSVAETTYEAWRKSARSVPGLYYDALEAPEVKDLTDRPAVLDALQVARGDSVWLNVERLADEIADPTTPEWKSRRFYLNQVVRADVERWMPLVEWEDAKREHPIPDGETVVIGFDGSFSGDSTAIVAVSVPLAIAPKDDDEATTPPLPHIDVVKCFENRVGDPDWRVPIEDVEDIIRGACRRWRVVEISADPHLWARSLEIFEKERLPAVEFPQSPARMIPATARFRQAIINGGATHSGDADLSRHVENAVVKVSSRGEQIVKDAKTSPRKIDLAVAAVMALERAAWHADNSRPLTPLVAFR